MQYSDPNAGLSGNNSPYDTPYGNAGMPFMGGQPERRRFGGRRSRGCLGCLVPLLVIVAILALLNVGFGLAFHWGPTTIQTSSNPTLVVESVANAHATIHIHAGSNGQIVIQPVRPLNLPFGLAESYQETSDHQTVIYDLGINTGGTYDITVPAQINLKIDSNNAALVVEGITGQMHLETNSGNLTVTNSTIIGPSLLRSNSGVMQTTGDHLNGSVTLDSNKGDITFQGSLDPAGTYHFANNGGTITLTLPQTTAAQLNGTTLNNGSINSNIAGAKAQKTVNGFTLQANLGPAPRAQLTLYNNGGDITINE